MSLRTGLLRRLVPWLAAAATFLAVSSGIRALVPWPEEYGLRAKVDYFAEHKDEFDCVFLGSSRVFRGIDPAVFDAEMARLGHPVRSFNLAVGGMETFEIDRVLHAVFGMEPARLRYVFVEGLPWDPNAYFFGNKHSTRNVAWHTAEQTRKVFGSIAKLDATTRFKVTSWLTHLQLFAWNHVSYGQGARIVGELRGTSRDPLGRAMTAEELEAGRGYQSLETMLGRERSKELDRLLADPRSYHARIQAIPILTARGFPLEFLDLAPLRAQYAAAEELDARLIYLIPPGRAPQAQVTSLAAGGHIAELIDFNRPDRYPSLFQLDRRFDSRHLNGRGAREFTRALAAEFAARIEEAAR